METITYRSKKELPKTEFEFRIEKSTGYKPGVVQRRTYTPTQESFPFFIRNTSVGKKLASLVRDFLTCSDHPLPREIKITIETD